MKKALTTIGKFELHLRMVLNITAIYRRCIFCSMLLFVGLDPTLVRAAPTLADFAIPPSFMNVTISPKGDYIATKIHLDDEQGMGLAVIRVSDNKVSAKIVVGDGQEVSRYWWVGASQLVIEPALHLDIEQPYATGELLSVDADGSNKKYLFGFRGPASTSAHPPPGVTRSNSSATILDPLPNDPEHALIEVADWKGDIDTKVMYSAKMNLINGALTDIVKAPLPGETDFLDDRNGDIRYAINRGGDVDGLHIFTRMREEPQWRAVGAPKNGTHLLPIGLSADGTKVYLLTNETTGRNCLAEQLLTTGERKILSCDDIADVNKVIYSFDGKEPIAVVYAAGKPKTILLSSEHPDAKLLQRLLLSFPDRIVDPISSTSDGSKVILLVYSDRDPGEYFLFDTKTSKAQSLAVAFGNIIPEEMGERRPISFKNRDGVMLHGFLTIPPGRELKNLPLIVNPHGGPFEISDEWGWENEAQMLATHGYAVLQVNFRGSGGFGSAFVAAGVYGWGTAMINDITDGTRWAIEQGYADRNRLCIYGASFGGYAALMSAVREPDLYRCVIASSGIYDLNLWTTDADFSHTKHGRQYVKDFVGATPEQLEAASPLTYIDNLKSALMIVHGKGDERTPYTQAQTLHDVLRVRKIPHEWLVKSDEGHGFYAPKNRVELYTRILAFLDKNIGQPADTSEPAATISTSKP